MKCPICHTDLQLAGGSLTSSDWTAPVVPTARPPLAAGWVRVENTKGGFRDWPTVESMAAPGVNPNDVSFGGYWMALANRPQPDGHLLVSRNVQPNGYSLSPLIQAKLAGGVNTYYECIDRFTYPLDWETATPDPRWDDVDAGLKNR